MSPEQLHRLAEIVHEAEPNPNGGMEIGHYAVARAVHVLANSLHQLANEVAAADRADRDLGDGE